MANPEKNTLADLSDDKLAKRKKNMFIIASIMLGIMLIAFVAGLYDEFVMGDDENNYLMFSVAVGASSAYFHSRYKQAKEELQRRMGQT
mgnify:CR=1 FL=1